MAPPRPYSPTQNFLRLDGRTKQGRLVAELRAALHGQFPAANPVQALVIDRLVGTCARLALLDQRLVEQKRQDGRKDPLTIRLYADLNHTFLRLLGVLGADPTLPDAQPAPQALDQYLAATPWHPDGGAAP